MCTAMTCPGNSNLACGNTTWMISYSRRIETDDGTDDDGTDDDGTNDDHW